MADGPMLAGGNPQIPKGDGDGPVQAYIAAMPGWKRRLGKRIDAVIEQTVPGVKKCVRWNSPFYGTDAGWFLNVHCFTDYVKITFFDGDQLDPQPPLAGKDPKARWVNVPEGGLDEEGLADWVAQAARLPGWDLR